MEPLKRIETNETDVNAATRHYWITSQNSRDPNQTCFGPAGCFR